MLVAVALVLAAGSLHADVIFPERGVTGLRGTAVGSFGDAQIRGNVFHLTYSGNFDNWVDGAPDQSARQALSALAVDAQGDDFDFVIAVTTFPVVLQVSDFLAAGVYHHIRNDVAGIGLPQFDHGAEWGSPSRLKGYIDLGRVGPSRLTPGSHGYQGLLETTMHEIMHRWSSYVRYRDAGGTVHNDLLGQMEAHWNSLLDTDASVMYGHRWAALGNGDFRSGPIRRTYAPIDLYLAGLLAPSELEPLTLLRNASPQPPELPQAQQQIHAEMSQVDVSAIIAAEGARLPSAASSQKHFRALLVLLSRPGETLDPAMLQALERFRRDAQERFGFMTRGRAVLHIVPNVVDARPGAPEAVAGSAPAGSSALDVSAALQWLEQSQAADGRWRDRDGSTWRDTAWALSALRLFAPQSPAIDTGVAALEQAPASTAESLAWRRMARNISAPVADIQAIEASQRADGGWGLTGAHSSGVEDTARILVAFADELTAQVREDAFGFLESSQVSDGAWSSYPGGSPGFAPSLSALEALSHPLAGHPAALDAGRQWLLARQRTNGSFRDGEDLLGIGDTARALQLLIGSDAPPQAFVRGGEYLRQLQGVSGDWSGSAFATAAAVQVLTALEQPNLRVIGGLSVLPDSPTQGALTRVTARIGNTGNQVVAASSARWYLGDPRSGGQALAGPVQVPELGPGSSVLVRHLWDTSGLSGVQQVWVVADDPEEIEELTRTDNYASIDIVIGDPPVGIDLALHPDALVASPAVIVSIPSEVRVTGELRNLGATGVASAVLQVQDVGVVPTRVLASTELEVPALAQVAFELTFEYDGLGTGQLRVVADPEGLIEDLDRSNNEASLTLTVVDGVDLAIERIDLDPPDGWQSGWPLELLVEVGNRGLSTAPPFELSIEVEDADGAVVLSETVEISLDAVASTTRSLAWLPATPGVHTITAHADPASLIDDADRSNNLMQRVVAIADGEGVNLRIDPVSITDEPQPALEGSAFQVEAMVWVEGVDPAPPFSLGLYVGVPGEGGALLGQVRQQDPLSPGSSRLLAIEIADLPLSGAHTLWIKADADDEVVETDEDDNLAVLDIDALSLPDLSVQTADIVVNPAVPVAGEPVHAEIRIHNLGRQAASQVRVDILEIGPSGQALAATYWIDLLDGETAVDVDLVWDFGLMADAEGLRVVVDPEGLIREGREDNNLADYALSVGEGPLFASNAYFSPNGDGVKDDTLLVFRLQQQHAVELIIEDLDGEVRRFHDFATTPVDRGQVRWDGRDSTGLVARDGIYQVRLTAGGHDLASTSVVVDNDRASLAAAQTRGRVFFNRIDEVRKGELAPLPYNDPALGAGWLLVDPLVPDEDEFVPLPGVYRSGVRTLEPVISNDWIGRRIAETGVPLEIAALAVSTDHRQVAVLASSGSSFDLWIADIAQLDQVQAVMLSVDAEAMLLAGMATNGRWVLFEGSQWSTDGMQVVSLDPLELLPQRGGRFTFSDFHSGAMRPLLLTHGVAALTSELKFAPYSGDSYDIELPYGQHYYRFNTLSASRSGGRLLVHRASESRESVELVDPVAQSVVTLAETERDTQECYQVIRPGGDRIDVLRLGAAWSPASDLIALLDPQLDRMLLLDSLGQTVAAIELPASDGIDYHDQMTVSDGELQFGRQSKGLQRMADKPVFAEEGFGSSDDWMCQEIGAAPPAMSGKAPLSDKGDDGPEQSLVYDRTLLWDPSGSRVVGVYGDLVEALHPGSGADVMALGHTRRVEVDVRRASVRILESGAQWPHVGQVGEPLVPESPHYGMHFQAPGSWAPQRLGYWTAGQLRPWMQPSGPFSVPFVWPDERAYALAETGCEECLPVVVLNMDRGLAHLEAALVGPNIDMGGFATDLHLAGWRIDLLAEQSSGGWRQVIGWTQGEVDDYRFLRWPPDVSGQILLRLQTEDLAGNRRSAYRRMLLPNPPLPRLLELLAAGPRYISPNGDGVQDAMVIDYEALLSQPFVFRVLDALGQEVFRRSVQHLPGELGAQQIVWAGDSDGGGRVADGDYEVELWSYAFPISVDTQAPQVSGAFFSRPFSFSNPPVMPIASIGATVSDPLLLSEQLEVRPWGSVLAWSAIASLRVGPVAISRSLYVANEFRIAAADAAGNRSLIPLQWPGDWLILRAASSIGVEFGEPPTATLEPVFPPWQWRWSRVRTVLPIDFTEEAWQQAQKLGPLRVEVDDDLRLHFVDLSRSGLATLHLETRDPDAGGWTSTEIDAAGFEGGQVVVPMAVLAGARTIVRLRGVTTAGGTLLSNPVLLEVENIGRLVRYNEHVHPALFPGLPQPPDGSCVWQHAFAPEPFLRREVWALPGSGSPQRVDPFREGLAGAIAYVMPPLSEGDLVEIRVETADGRTIVHRSTSPCMAGEPPSPPLEGVPIDIATIPAPDCGSHAGALRVRVGPPVSASGPASIAVERALGELVNAGGQTLTTLFDVSDPANQVDPPGTCTAGEFLVDETLPLGSLAPGAYSLRVIVSTDDGESHQAHLDFDVHASPPGFNVIEPEDQATLCLVEPSTRLPAELAFHDTRRKGLLIEVSRPMPDGSVYTDFAPVASGSVGQIPDWWVCGGAIDAPRIGLEGFDLPRSFDWPINPPRSPQSHFGLMDLAFHTLDRAGGHACATRRVRVDTRVEIENAVLSPVRTWSQRRTPVLSQAGSPSFLQAIYRNVAHEALTARLVVHAAEYISNAWRPVGPPLHTGPPLAFSGPIELHWSGMLDLGYADDGFYLVMPIFEDGCRDSQPQGKLIEVDSTPPGISVLHPQPGQIVTSSLLEISGTVIDKYFNAYSVELGIGASPITWTLIDGSDEEVPEVSTLGVANLEGLSGAAVVRVRATDKLGNRSELRVPIFLDPPPPVLSDFEVDPVLFSPNGDGRLDTSAIQFGLSVQAQVTLAVLDESSSSTVAVLIADALLEADSHVREWNGAANAGVVVADGRYRVIATAVSTADPDLVGEIEHSVVVDTTPPDLDLVEPATEHTQGLGPILLSITERHPKNLVFQLVGPGDGIVDSDDVALSGVDPDLGLTDLTDLDEGSYTLNLDAWDRAENHASEVVDFVIDRTPPALELHEPLDESHLRPDQVIALRGLIEEPHLALWGVRLAEQADVPEWLDLHTAIDAPTDDLLYEWPVDLPDGEYLLRLWARDRAGNESELDHRITVDGTAPELAVDAPLADSWAGPQLDIHGTVTDLHLASYIVEVATQADAAQGLWTELHADTDGVEAALIASVRPSLPSGPAALRMRAYDRAGNETELVRAFQYVASLPPAPSGLVARVEQRRDVRLDWQPLVHEVALVGYHVYRNDARITVQPLPGISHLDVGLEEGHYRYVVSAVDVAGNESAPSAPAFVQIHLSAPEVFLQHPRADDRVRGMVEVTGTADAEEGFASYRLEAVPLSGGNAILIAQSGQPRRGEVLGQWDTRGLPEDAQYNLRLEAFDSFGNHAETGLTVVIDNLPPQAPTGLTAEIDDPDVQLEWNANGESDLLGYLLYRDGVLVHWIGSLPADLRPLALTTTDYRDRTVPDGVHTYRVFAIDQAGNISAPSEPAVVSIDRGPPSMRFVEPVQGHAFETSVRVRAESDDTDIDEVRFELRPEGGGTWQPLGAALTERPYRIVWTPDGLPWGEYDIRVIATDLGGLIDPQPPVLRLRFADLTPPHVPQGLNATVDGDRVELAWDAVQDDDLAGYLLYRGETQLTTVPQTEPSYTDTGRPLGVHVYRVAAQDGSGNVSDLSAAVEALVHRPLLKQPYSPTPEPFTELRGAAAVTGEILGEVAHAQGSHPVSVATDADGLFAAPNLPLEVGANTATVRLHHGDGNRSLPASVPVVHGLPPEPPTGLGGLVNGHDVSVNWTAHPSAEVIGYRLFRNDLALPADVAAPAPAQVSASHGNAMRALDGNAGTAWGDSENLAATPTDLWMQIDFAEPQLIVQVELDWSSERRALDFEIQGGFQGVWVPLATVTGNQSENNQLLLPRPYRSDRLRLRITRLAASGWFSLGLAELRVRVRPLISGTEQAFPGLLDGPYRFEVTAVDGYGFESARSDSIELDVGDVEPPPAVVLGGTVIDADVHLSWTESVADDLDHYRVLRDGAIIGTVPIDASRTYVDPALANGSYDYTVLAVDHVGNGQPSNVYTATIDIDPPGAPTIISVTAPPEGAALVVSWAAPEGESPTGYRLHRSLDVAGPYDAVAEVAALEHRDEPLINGVTYHYTVQALDGSGNAGAHSEPASGTPARILAPDAPVFHWPGRGGEQVHVTTADTPVLGAAEPGVRVDLHRQQTLLGSTFARSESGVDETRTWPTGLYRYRLSSDSRWLWVAPYDAGERIIDLLGDREYGLVGEGRSVAWDAVRGELWRVRWEGAIELIDGRSGSIATIDSPLSDTEFASPEPGGKRALLIGYPDPFANFAGFIWDRDDDSVRELPAAISGYSASRTLAWGGPGRFAWIQSGSLHVFNVDTDELQVLGSGLIDEPVAWAPDAPMVVAVGWLNNGYRLQVFDVELGDVLVPDLPAGALRAPVFDPGGTLLAAHTFNGVSVFDPLAGTVVDSWTVEGPTAVAWPAPLEMHFVRYSGLSRLRVAGAFSFDSVDLQPGDNLLHARAVDDFGNGSVASQVLNVVRDDVVLPDIAIAAADIRILPAGGAPGESFALRATVRNPGAAASEAVEARVTLDGPHGSLGPGQMLHLPAIAAGGAHVLEAALGTLADAGPHSVRVELDPLRQLVEVTRDNNVASRAFLVDGGNAPRLFVDLADESLAPGQNLISDLRVYNGGPSFSGAVQLAVVDAQGHAVADLGEESVGPLAFGALWRRDVVWMPGETLAGDYLLRARLRDVAGGLVEVVEAHFSIELATVIDLTVGPELPDYPSGGEAHIVSSLSVIEANGFLTDASLRLSALDHQGQELWTALRPLGQLPPGYQSAHVTPWDLSEVAPGSYALRLVFESATLQQTAYGSVDVRPSGPGQALVGTLDFAPRPIALGDPARVEWSLLSSTPRTQLPLRLRLLRPTGMQMVAAVEFHVDAEPGITVTGQHAFVDATLAAGDYLALFEYRNGTDGDWLPLASRSSAAVDLMPPVVTLLQPQQGAVVRSPVSVRARIVDAHSAIANAEARVGDGAWRRLFEDGGGDYERSVDGMPEGPASVVARASDQAGNLAVSLPHAFTVDDTPPQITVTGVSDGDLRNHPVAPVVQVFDLHPGSVDIRLNGVPFVSGTEVADEGPHLLTVEAFDQAGNRAWRQVGFEIDLTPPPVAFLQPLDGETTPEVRIEIHVASEPGAMIHLALDDYDADLIADADGLAIFSDVALRLGSNLVGASAEDAAGNIGGPVQITVWREFDTGALQGSVLPAAVEFPVGADVAGSWEVTNGGSVGLENLEVRIRVWHGAHVEPLGERIDVADLPAGATWTQPWSFASGSWPLGDLALVLEAREGGAAEWFGLDSASVSLADRTSPLVEVLEPATGAIVGGSFVVRAHAIDTHSSIVAVAVSVDAGDWLPLTAEPGVPDVYLRGLDDLPEGERNLRVRAIDAWGNTALTEPVIVTVDRTAPLIVIQGIEDGGLYAQTVIPEYSVTDANPVTHEATLNGLPFASGTPVSAEGSHVLRIDAEDAAGNLAEASVQFEIDLTPPDLVFTHPQPGAIVLMAETMISGLTEPLAQVYLAGPLGNMQTVADAGGAFVVPSWPLAQGLNTISGHAVDRAGNVGSDAHLDIEYRANAGVNVEASLALDPQWIEPGTEFDAGIQLHNTADVDADGLPLRLVVRSTTRGNQPPLYEDSWQQDIDAGAVLDLQRIIATDGWPLGSVLAELSAQITQSDGAQSWIVLATAAGTVADLTPPALDWVAPPAGSYHRVAFEAVLHATDALSAVDRVEVRVGEGFWVVLSADGDGVHWRAMLDPAEGTHALHARAFDAHDNMREIATRTVHVDRTPPSIQVDGIADGHLGNQPVTLSWTVEDASQVTSAATLNGLPIASGSTVSAEGVHRLVVSAEDAAGNTAEATVDFELDLTPPTIVVHHPLDGQVLWQPQTTVLGATEALADVSLVLGATALEVEAGSDGAFQFAKVALEPGENLFVLQATDRAGNLGESISLSVWRATAGDVDLIGFVELPIPEWPAGGEPVPFEIRVLNGSEFDIQSAGIELSVRASTGGEPLAVWTWQQTLVAGAELAEQGNWPTEDIAPGDYSFSLRAQVPDGDGGQTWQALRQASLHLPDREAPTVLLVEPIAGDLLLPGDAVRIEADDRLSAIAAVEFRIDQGQWRPTEPAGGNAFHAAWPSVGEGVFTVEARALDDWGNEARTPPITVSGRGSAVPEAVPIPVGVTALWLLQLILLAGTAAIVIGRRGRDAP